MRFLTGILLAIVAVATAATPAVAQNPNTTAPDIIIAHKGAEKVKTDLKAILDLTPPAQQKQWAVVNKFLGAFLAGVDEKKPIRMDLVIPTQGPVQYVFSVPIAPGQLNAFRAQNLTPAGINTRRIQSSLYQCRGQVYTGYMRFRNDYATFAEDRRMVPLNLQDPSIKIKALLAAYDAGLIANNEKADPASVAARRNWVAAQWKELAAGLKKREGESEGDFAFRKTMFGLQQAEAERFYAEAKNLTVGWKLDLPNMLGRGDVMLEAIPGTSLQQAIQLLGKTPSHFVNIPRRKDSIFSLRVNHPLDKQRSDSLIAIFKAIEGREIDRVKADKTKNEKQINAQTEIIKIIVKILSENADKKIFDAYVDVHPNAAGKHTAVMGFRTVDGRVAADALKLLPDANAQHAVKMKVAKVGDVDIHHVNFAFGKESLFGEILGDKNVYIGLSKETLWVAGGANGLKELETAIKLTAGPAAGKKDEPIAELLVRFAPWVAANAAAHPNAANPAMRKIAAGAFVGKKDGLLMTLHRDNNKVIGKMDVQTDLMRFVGSMFAKFSEENLDDSNPNSKKKKPKTAR